MVIFSFAKREIIKILDDEDDDILDQHINEESIQQQYEDKLPKFKEHEENDMSEEAVEIEDEYRRSKRNRTANRDLESSVCLEFKIFSLTEKGSSFLCSSIPPIPLPWANSIMGEGNLPRTLTPWSSADPNMVRSATTSWVRFEGGVVMQKF